MSSLENIVKIGTDSISAVNSLPTDLLQNLGTLSSLNTSLVAQQNIASQLPFDWDTLDRLLHPPEPVKLAEIPSPASHTSNLSAAVDILALIAKNLDSQTAQLKSQTAELAKIAKAAEERAVQAQNEAQTSKQLAEASQKSAEAAQQIAEASKERARLAQERAEAAAQEAAAAECTAKQARKSSKISNIIAALAVVVALLSWLFPSGFILDRVGNFFPSRQLSYCPVEVENRETLQNVHQNLHVFTPFC